ncbi:MAG TPA: hypothetical protein VFC18_04515 [Burkholderiales bacterium]|nr:hypothetical protein [Burkholderiales bacterium]
MRAALRIAAASLAFIAWPALGQDCKAIETKLGNDPLRMLQFLYFGKCLGGENDSESVTGEINELIRQVTTRAPGTAGNALEEALKRVSDYVSTSARERETRSQPLLAAIKTEIDSVREKLTKQEPLVDQDVVGWQWQDTRFRGLPDVNVASLNVMCPPSEPKLCAEASATGKVVFRAAALVTRTLQLSLTDEYEQALAAARLRKAKWDRYFDEARVQFFWELYANGLRYGRENRKAGGFAEPPHDQIILLHPGVGLEYVNDAPSGSRLQAALVIELIGYNRWTWSKQGKMENAFGASLIQSYSDRAGLASARPGIMVHFQNKYSLAYTRRDGVDGLMLSIDLAKLVTKVEQDAREKFKLGGRGE